MGRKHAAAIAFGVEKLGEVPHFVGQGGLRQNDFSSRLRDTREGGCQVVARDQVDRGGAPARLVAFAVNQAAAVLPQLAWEDGELIRPQFLELRRPREDRVEKPL